MFSLQRNKSDKGKGRGGQTFHVFISFLSVYVKVFVLDWALKVVIHVGKWWFMLVAVIEEEDLMVRWWALLGFLNEG